MRKSLILALSMLALAGCSHLHTPPPDAPATLKIASWNMEHLAEADGAGCRPRTETDYAAMRDYVSSMNADVIAFQEVETAAAAERVFDPALYTIVIEERPGSGRDGICNGLAGQTIKAQRTGFAIRKAVPFDRQPDLTALQLGDPDLRSGVDLILRPARGNAVRVLSVHMKSGCSSGDSNAACSTLLQQVPVLEDWIDARSGEPLRFAVLGDFNRRLATFGDRVWSDWDDGSPANSDLTLASGEEAARCNPRYRDFIDFVVLDRRAASDLMSSEEATFSGPALSDHCAIWVGLTYR